jgi:protein-S-isoprenylcysteine O-methyltransferase Ste14
MHLEQASDGVPMENDAGDGFIARGGAWALGQGPALLLTLVVPMRTGADALTLQSASDWLAAAMTAVGGGVALAGVLALGKSLTPFPRPLAEATLCDSGLYAFVRHPIYFGLIIASGGWTWWWHSGWGLLCCIGTAVFLDRKAAREEIWLREKYSTYAAYAQRVRRLLPWIY